MPELPLEQVSGLARMREVVRLWTPGNLLSAPVFGVSLVFTGVGNISLEGDPVTRPVERLVVLIAVHVLLFGVVWSATKLLPRAFVGPRGWLVLALTLQAGALLRALALAAAFTLFDVGTPLLAQRIGNSFVNPTIVILALTAVWGALRDHREARRGIRLVRARLAMREGAVTSAETQLAPAQLAALKAELRAALRGVTDSTASPRVAADILRAAIDTVIRPVTQSLGPAQVIADPTISSASPAHGRTRVGPRTPAILALDLARAWPIAVPLLAVVQGLPAATSILGPIRGVLASLAALLASHLILLAGRTAAVRWPGPWSRFAHVLVSALAGAATYAVTVGFSGGQPGPTPLWAIVVFFVVCGYLLALADSTFAQAAASRAELSAENRSLAHQLARRRAQVHVRHSSLTRALHGTVQAILTAAYLRLQLALNSGSSADVAASLQAARGDSERAVEAVREGSIDRATLTEIVAVLNETWDDLSSIVLTATAADVERVWADPLCSAIVTEVLPELVFNAIKHSTAASVAIAVDWPDEDSLRLLLDYDHRPSAAPTSPSGLGDRTLDDVSLRWSREFDGTHGRTEVVLAWDSRR